MTDVTDYRATEDRVDVSQRVQTLAAPAPDQELLTLNMGPHHPATHGVLRLLVTLEAEIVRDLKPIIGYVHTGIEKTAEDKSYWKAIPVVERMDYLAYYFNAMAFCGATETLLDVEVPKRAQYLRVIHMELNRIMSHLVWLGTSMLDLGAVSVWWYCFREREQILDLFEYSSGQRMHTRYFQVGGVMEDIPAGWETNLRKFLKKMPWAVDQYLDLLNRNEIALRRLRNTCPLDEQTLLDLGVTGPLLRASGNPWDLRKAMPYSSYEDFEFKIPIGTRGDNYDRFAVRMQEILESVKIIEQALDGLPEGPYITEDRKVALPPRHELATSMEALIHHFKLVTEGFRVPPGEVYYPIEGPRGEYGMFIRSDGSSKPARVHMRDPSLREPPGDAADGQGLLHRRPHHHAGDDGPGARRGGSLAPCRCPTSSASRTARASPAGTTRSTSPRTRRRSRTRRPRRCPTSCAPPSRRTSPSTRTVAARRSRRCRRPGAARLVLARGVHPGRVRDAADAGLPDRRRVVLRHVGHAAGGPQARLRVHQHLVLAARRRKLLADLTEAIGDDPDIQVRGFECLGACDIAPMASIDGVFVGPIEDGEVAELAQQVRDGADPLPAKQLLKRPSADPHANTRAPQEGTE